MSSVKPVSTTLLRKHVFNFPVGKEIEGMKDQEILDTVYNSTPPTMRFISCLTLAAQYIYFELKKKIKLNLNDHFAFDQQSIIIYHINNIIGELDMIVSKFNKNSFNVGCTIDVTTHPQGFKVIVKMNDDAENAPYWKMFHSYDPIVLPQEYTSFMKAQNAKTVNESINKYSNPLLEPEKQKILAVPPKIPVDTMDSVDRALKKRKHEELVIYKPSRPLADKLMNSIISNGFLYHQNLGSYDKSVDEPINALWQTFVDFSKKKFKPEHQKAVESIESMIKGSNSVKMELVSTQKQKMPPTDIWGEPIAEFVFVYTLQNDKVILTIPKMKDFVDCIFLAKNIGLYYTLMAVRGFPQSFEDEILISLPRILAFIEKFRVVMQQNKPQ